MASSCSFTSPLCTWLVAACMSFTCGSRDPHQPPSVLRRYTNNKREGLSAARRRKLSAKCGVGGEVVNGSLVSSFSGSSHSIQSLMASCLPFEPCNEYYSSVSSLGFFGDNGFSSFFGSNNSTATLNRRQRRLRLNRVTRSGNLSISFVPISCCILNSLPWNLGEAMAVAVQPDEEVTTKKKPHMKQRRVVVTGMGLVSPLGHEPDVFYNNLLEGVSGISEIETFDCTSFPTKIAAEIKSFSTDGWVAPKLSKRMDKFMLYLLTAGKKALADGGITEDVMNELDKSKCGVLIGSGLGGMKVFYDAIEALRISYKKMNPFCVPFATTNMGSAMLAMDLGWMGPNYSISTACATSNFCILNAANHIIRGEANVMLCGGSDAAVIPIGLGGFVACRALSQRNNDPTKASRPWDINRDGFVMGEGAGVLLLEELEHAKKRGAKIYAEFRGGSFTSDAYHMTEPHPDDLQYAQLRVNSTKSMIGHLLGAAGAVEAIAVVQAIRTGWIHPNINLENPDAVVDTNVLVGPKKERLEVKAALSNSFGFGGHNSSIIFSPYK
ncbi:3-oxoacyl-(acyl-carrier-protein) synthase II [Citrus sinensis]|uniref:3-oxoacyl-(Acyl-carrier-protein) synthase II n=1 Tax=Citrus sinensis TaxID=2711 RepID=A0ACB8P4D4_CITSI|nr:3-oxoacyl-(acyl-carrier-protein) synthase II [Citrus sinensis]